ncbi:glycoside hydrolase family 1 protein [Trichoderma afarasin]
MLAALLLFVAGAFGQQVYIHTHGPNTPSACKANPTHQVFGKTPKYEYSQFKFTNTETVRTASPVPTFSAVSQYAPHYSQVKHLLPSLSTTSWGNWYAHPTKAPIHDSKDPYGHFAYSQLWENAGVPNFTSRGLYSTTVRPTPVPTSELVFPPPLLFESSDCYPVPHDFILGVAGSAAQIEGAIADEGRAPAIPEMFTFLPPGVAATLGITNLSPNYVTDENYYLYKQDIERLASIGVKYYSFSIAWSRILPFVFPNTPVNSQAIAHYDDVINFAISKGITPVVTLHHFDTPLQFFGDNQTEILINSNTRCYLGTTNLGFQHERFEDAFVNYGKIVMGHFADRVPFWFTFNEPQVGTVNGRSIDHVIKAHAKLYHFYKDELRGTGKISMKMEIPPGVPLDPSQKSHVAAAAHFNDLQLGPFLYPLALGEDYPAAYKMTVQDYVPLSKADLCNLKGTLDFIAMDVYTAPIIFPVTNNIAACAANNKTSNALYPNCVGVTETTSNGWLIGQPSNSIQMYTTPTYLRTQISYLWNTFRAPVMITEFGHSTNGTANPPQLNAIQYDTVRSEFYISFLREMLKAIWEDHVHVLGAFMWSFVDNWEWGSFDSQFGLQYVNRTTQQRTYKRSFFDVVDYIESRRSQPSR